MALENILARKANQIDNGCFIVSISLFIPAFILLMQNYISIPIFGAVASFPAFLNLFWFFFNKGFLENENSKVFKWFKFPTWSKKHNLILRNQTLLRELTAQLLGNIDKQLDLLDYFHNQRIQPIWDQMYRYHFQQLSIGLRESNAQQIIQSIKEMLTTINYNNPPEEDYYEKLKSLKTNQPFHKLL